MTDSLAYFADARDRAAFDKLAAENPFLALETLSAPVALRIATALCYADDVSTLCRCLSFGDRLAGRIEYFAVKPATSSWLDGGTFASFGYREGLECPDTFAAFQESAWAYLDVLDAREAAERSGKVG